MHIFRETMELSNWSC